MGVSPPAHLRNTSCETVPVVPKKGSGFQWINFYEPKSRYGLARSHATVGKHVAMAYPNTRF